MAYADTTQMQDVCFKRKEEFVMKKEEMWWSFYRFLHLDLVDLDAEQFVFEVIVEIETVSILHIFSSRVLVEDTCLPAGQGLQRTP